MIIAIQPDNYGVNDSSSPIWSKCLIDSGCQVKYVDVYQSDILDQLQGCDAFMWRHAHVPHMRQVARRLLPIIENELGLAVYPDQNTCWHYDDKVTQAYLFKAKKIPSPETWVWFDQDSAISWLKTSTFPLVLKLWSGAGSSNVMLINTLMEAEYWVNKLFEEGVGSLTVDVNSFRERLWHIARILIKGKLKCPWELHKNYVLFQEFLPGNEFDTRVTIIGDRAFAYRRFNREKDFRASGSGNADYSPENISPEMIKLAFKTAKKLNMKSCAIDGLWKGGEPVVGEVSYTYVSWMVHSCPGYWDQNLKWHDGHVWPEEAQVEDFLANIKGG